MEPQCQSSVPGIHRAMETPDGSSVLTTQLVNALPFTSTETSHGIKLKKNLYRQQMIAVPDENSLMTVGFLHKTII